MSGYHSKLTTWETKKENPKILLSFTYPERINHHYYYRRKFRITIKYLCEHGQERYKTVYFGFDGEKPTKEPENIDIFHPYFWEKRLIGNEEMSKLFIKTVDELLPKDVIKLEKKK